MGDAIMAFWNAPLDDPDHEANACDAALDMLERLDTLNGEREEEAEASGKPFIPIKIGDRHQYRPVRGRQHGLRHALPVHGARRFGEYRVAPRRSDQILRRSDPDRVAHRGGREGQVRRSSRSTASPSKARPSPRSSIRWWAARSWRSRTNSRLLQASVAPDVARYRARDWSGAIGRCKIAGLQRAFSPRGVAELVQERIQAFEQNPPPPDWNGVFALQTK